MESKRMILRRSVRNDLRLKQLVLTDEAKMIVESVKKDLNDFEERLTLGLTKEDKDNLFSIMNKLENNILGGKKNAS
jgi:DNA-binding MarR family transcriptional regulator